MPSSQEECILGKVKTKENKKMMRDGKWHMSAAYAQISASSGEREKPLMAPKTKKQGIR